MRHESASPLSLHVVLFDPGDEPIRCRLLLIALLTSGIPKQVMMSCSAGHWYISIQTEFEVDTQLHPSTSAIGIDFEISKLFALLDGRHIPSLNSFRTHQEKLARLQWGLSREQKFSDSWKPQKLKIQCLSISGLQTAVGSICKNDAMIVMEDLQVSNMSRSVKDSLLVFSGLGIE